MNYCKLLRGRELYTRYKPAKLIDRRNLIYSQKVLEISHLIRTKKIALGIPATLN